MIRPIVLTTGTFDVIHPGHVALLRGITSLFPDYELVVGINGDRRAGELKERVVFTAAERAAIVGSIKGVSQAVVFEEDDPSGLIRRLKPKIFIKGPDWKFQAIAEMDACNEVNCMVFFLGKKTHNSSCIKRTMALCRA